MTSMHHPASFPRSRSLWLSIGVMVVVLLGWIGYPSRSTDAGEAGDPMSLAPPQSDLKAQESTFQAYSSWLAGAHQRVAKEAPGGLHLDQF